MRFYLWCSGTDFVRERLLNRHGQRLTAMAQSSSRSVFCEQILVNCRKIYRASEVHSMPGTTTGLFIIDFFCKPCLKFGLKHPLFGLAALILVYGFVAYHIIKSAFMATDD